MMDEDGWSKDRAGRRAKRFLTPIQKYEIWLQLVRGEVTMADAAATAGVDRTKIRPSRDRAGWPAGTGSSGHTSTAAKKRPSAIPASSAS